MSQGIVIISRHRPTIGQLQFVVSQSDNYKMAGSRKQAQ